MGGFVGLAFAVLGGATRFVPIILRSTTRYAELTAAVDQSLPPSALIADSVKRSTKAHLFHFYPILCEIVAIPRKAPTAWVMAMTSAHRTSIETNSAGSEGSTTAGHAVELDARNLVKDCLKEVGRELGVGH